jgi:molybdate transport system substrate-binding protein
MKYSLRKKYEKIILIALAFLLAIPLSSFATEITVAGAANVQFTLEDLKAEFTKETGIGVKSVIGSSGKLTSQIENGAPFDIFLSADMKYPATLYKEGFSLRSPKVYVYGVLVLWTMKNLDLSKGVNVLTDSGVQKIALANPELAPYGRQAVNALKFYQLYEQLQKKLVLGESISQANQFITTGAADIGFTAKSVVLAANMKDKGKWIEVDSQSYEPIAQGVIVLKYAQQNHSKEAQEFYDFLFSAPAQEIFKKYGYKLP